MSLIACCNGQQVLRSTCGTPANVKANAGRLAGLPQTPKQMPGDLRDSRKRQSKCRETCGTPANAKVNAGGLAGVSANAKVNAGRLAGLPANVKANAGRLAGLPQTSKQMPGDLQEYPQTPKSSSRHLQQCCRHFQKRFGRASVETLCGLYSYTELTLYSVFCVLLAL